MDFIIIDWQFPRIMRESPFYDILWFNCCISVHTNRQLLSEKIQLLSIAWCYCYYKYWFCTVFYAVKPLKKLVRCPKKRYFTQPIEFIVKVSISAYSSFLHCWFLRYVTSICICGSCAWIRVINVLSVQELTLSDLKQLGQMYMFTSAYNSYCYCMLWTVGRIKHIDVLFERILTASGVSLVRCCCQCCCCCCCCCCCGS